MKRTYYISLSVTRGESLRSLWIATGRCAEKERADGWRWENELVRSSVFIKQTKPQTGSNRSYRILGSLRAGSGHGKDGNSIVGSMFDLDISHVGSIAVCEESARSFVRSRLDS